MRRPLILIDALAYHPEDGGFATDMKQVLRTCATIDDFDFVIAHHRQFTSFFAGFGLPTHPVHFPSALRQVASLLLLPLIVKRVRPDAVFCECSALPAGLGVPGAVAVHDFAFLADASTAGRSWRRRLIVRLYWRGVYLRSLHHAGVVKAVSDATAEEARALLGDGARVMVVPHRVDPPKELARRCWPDPGEPLRLLFLGSVVPRRNLPFLLDALPLLRGNWTLDVVGQISSGRQELGRMVDDPRVRLHGYVPDLERDRFLEESHILVNPALQEGFSFPVAEAMSRAMLVMTSDIPVFREYVADECRFSLEHPRSLADRYNGLDAATYERLRFAGRRAIDRFSADAHADAHRTLFRALLQMTGAPLAS